MRYILIPHERYVSSYVSEQCCCALRAACTQGLNHYFHDFQGVNARHDGYSQWMNRYSIIQKLKIPAESLSLILL